MKKTNVTNLWKIIFFGFFVFNLIDPKDKIFKKFGVYPNNFEPRYHCIKTFKINNIFYTLSCGGWGDDAHCIQCNNTLKVASTVHSEKIDNESVLGVTFGADS